MISPRIVERGMGEAYLAQDTSLGRNVVLKLRPFGMSPRQRDGETRPGKSWVN
jgi:hypothetical protein